MLPLGLAFAALLVVSGLLRDACLVRAAAVLLANWCVNTAFAYLSGTQFSWIVMFATDNLSAVLLLYLCPTRRMALLGLTYVVELLAHIGFAASHQDYPAMLAYWYTLFGIAVLQAVLLGLYILTGGGKMALGRWHGHRRPSHARPMSDGVATRSASR